MIQYLTKLFQCCKYLLLVDCGCYMAIANAHVALQ
jgi:hypothetical protein